MEVVESYKHLSRERNDIKEVFNKMTEEEGGEGQIDLSRV